MTRYYLALAVTAVMGTTAVAQITSPPAAHGNAARSAMTAPAAPARSSPGGEKPSTGGAGMQPSPAAAAGATNCGVTTKDKVKAGVQTVKGWADNHKCEVEIAKTGLSLRNAATWCAAAEVAPPALGPCVYYGIKTAINGGNAVNACLTSASKGSKAGSTAPLGGKATAAKTTGAPSVSAAKPVAAPKAMSPAAGKPVDCAKALANLGGTGHASTASSASPDTSGKGTSQGKGNAPGNGSKVGAGNNGGGGKGGTGGKGGNSGGGKSGGGGKGR